MNQRVNLFKAKDENGALISKFYPKASSHFASLVFHRGLIQELPKKASENWLGILDGKERLDLTLLSEIAFGIKNWAVRKGATRYTHWFHSLSNLEELSDIKTFNAEKLLKEGLESIAWDPMIYPFILEQAGMKILCIPSIFRSEGDPKAILSRSLEKLEKAVLRLLKVFQKKGDSVLIKVGIDQEFFLLKEEIVQSREDLNFTGRTLFSAAKSVAPKTPNSLGSDEIQFFHQFEKCALELGIPIKRRCYDPTSTQHQISVHVERAEFATHHNLLLMHLLKSLAKEQGLRCIFHEKPFHHLRGSKKKCAWSIAFNQEINLFDSENDPIIFIIAFSAMIKAVFDDQGLLEAAIGSSGNDLQLKGESAPFASFISPLAFEKSSFLKKILDLCLQKLQEQENAFLTFEDDHFNLNALGSSMDPSFAITVINLIFSRSLDLILDEIESTLEDQNLTEEEIFERVFPILAKHLKSLGSEEKKDFKSSYEAFSELLSKKTVSIFDQVLSEKGLNLLYENSVQKYVQENLHEMKWMIKFFEETLLPAVEKEKSEKRQLLEKAIQIYDDLKKNLSQIEDMGSIGKGKVISELLFEKIERFRSIVDEL